MTSNSEQNNAGHTLEACWDLIRKQDYTSSFAGVREFVTKSNPGLRKRRSARSRATWLAVLSIVLLFFSCGRTNYVEPQAAVLSFYAPDSLLPEIDALLQPYQKRSWKAIFWPKNGLMRGEIATSAAHFEELKEVAAKIKTMSGVHALFLSAMKTPVRESPLSHLCYRVFHQRFNASVAGDQEWKDAITRQLRKFGREDIALNLFTRNGRREVGLIPGTAPKDFALEIKLRDGGSLSVLAEKW